MALKAKRGEEKAARSRRKQKERDISGERSVEATVERVAGEHFAERSGSAGTSAGAGENGRPESETVRPRVGRKRGNAHIATSPTDDREELRRTV